MRTNQTKGSGPTSPRSLSAPRSNNHPPNHVVPINPIATLSHKDKLLLAETFKKTPSKQVISPAAAFRFNPQDYLFDLEDDETNIIVENNVIKAASMLCTTHSNMFVPFHDHNDIYSSCWKASWESYYRTLRRYIAIIIVYVIIVIFVGLSHVLLTHMFLLDVTFMYEFLLTYRQFTTPQALMDLLFARYDTFHYIITILPFFSFHWSSKLFYARTSSDVCWGIWSFP